MINTAKTPDTTQVLQQIYLRISLGSWVGYTLRTIPKGRALLDESGNQTQECIYAPTRGVCTLRAHPKKLAQVYLQMQIRDTLHATEQQTKGKDDSEGIRTLTPRMINAKQELLDHVKERCVGGRTVRCAKITLGNTYNGDNKNHHILPIDYTTEDLQLFLAGIDQEYKNGYGSQNLYGMIWYTDGSTWSQRGEYDGSECWEFMECPEIGPEMMGVPDSRF